MNVKTERFWIRCLLWGIFAGGLSVYTPLVLAQKGPYPVERYYHGVEFLSQGSPITALKYYQENLRSAIKIGNARWIDSICYYTMIGESLFLAGKTEEALEAYNAAIALYLQSPKWLTRVSYPFANGSSTARLETPWGAGDRTATIGVFPKEALVTVGEDVDERLRQQGVVSQQEMHKINPIEILRCMAVSLRRRSEIMGPLCPFDPLSEELVHAFSSRPVPATHWSVPYLDVLFGLALEGNGKKSEARQILESSLVIAGQNDHPLTATALFEIGRISLEEEKTQEALAYFYEASISAFHFNEPLLIEESLRYYANVSRTLNRMGNDPVVLSAFSWAKQQRFSLMSLSLGLEVVENLLIQRHLPQAETGLKRLESMLANSQFRASRFADRCNYLHALLFYVNGDIVSGDAFLSRVMEGMKTNSLWIYQVARLDSLAKSDGLGAGSTVFRNTANLYETLLREPTAIDWAIRPMDSLAVQLVIPASAYERWFKSLQNLDLRDKAFDVAERIRRERFYKTQEFGGRLLSLRYMMEGADSVLSNEFKICRQDLLVEFPELNESSRQIRQIKQQLNSLPVLPKESAEKDAQMHLLTELERLSQLQESQMKAIAASRMQIPLTFPPIKTVTQIQAELAPETSMLIFIEAEGDFYAFMLTKEILDCWRIAPTDSLTGMTATFLKELGNVADNRPLSSKVESSNAWKQNANELLRFIMGDPNSGRERFNVQFKHLVIVPDTVLWYLPFEALCLPKGEGEWAPLLEIPEVTLRYAATAGLGVPSRPARNPFVETTVVGGGLATKEPLEVQEKALARLGQVVPDMKLFPEGSSFATAPILAPRLRQLLVLREIQGIKSESADWTPFLANANRQDQSVSQWIYLPWGAPRLIVLPAFRSMAENSLKNGGDGREFFYPLLCLQSTGAETVLISRWRTGGRSTYDLVTSFMKNFADTQNSPALAWKKAVESQRATDLVVEEEPRFKKLSSKAPVPKAEHPFFWAGYMLVSPGEREAIVDVAANADQDLLTHELTPEELEKLKSEGQTPQPAGTPASPTDPAAPSDVDFENMEMGTTDAETQGTIDADGEESPASDGETPAESDGSDAETQADSSANADGLQPVIRVPEAQEGQATPAEIEPGPEDASGSDTPAASNATPPAQGDSNQKEPQNQEKDKAAQDDKAGKKDSTARPAAPRPVTDEDIESDDEEADDFFSGNDE